MDKHVTILGGLFVGLAVLAFVGMLVIIVVFGAGSAILSAIAAEEPDMPEILLFLPLTFGVFITFLIGITGISALVAGYGLLKRRSWSKVAALIAGIVNVPSFPVGTAVAVYTIWVFLQDETDQVIGAR
jgi:hypothetical protein